MSFTITIDFDLTPEDLELLKAIGERVDYSIGHAGKRRLDNTTVEPITEAQAVKDLLREALRANRAVFIPTVPMSKAHLADLNATDLDSPGIDEGLEGGGK